ncbi:hypothetical protein MPSEU_000400400 [Mayamaea pseudoterrestris]|nr:hypothetical protein MPSEU_000400400 [Mayamaea pseudoterrestris]
MSAKSSDPFASSETTITKPSVRSIKYTTNIRSSLNDDEATQTATTKELLTDSVELNSMSLDDKAANPSTSGSASPPVDAAPRAASASSPSLPDVVFKYPLNATRIDGHTVPIPLRVMERYVQQHSVDALRNDPHPEHRRYAIAFTQCPLQAGNHAHIFWNGILWSILTNRTVLYKYWDQETCLKHGQNIHKHICKMANTEADCAQVLVRAPWIASYDEWKHVFDEDGEPFQIPYHATMGRSRDEPRFPVPDNYEESYGVDLVSKYPQRLVIFSECYSKFQQLANSALQETVLLSEYGRKTVVELFSRGDNFLYGMLHRYTFELAAPLRAKVLESTPTLLNDTDYYTIGLHSRHRFDSLDGCDISREIDCFRQVLSSPRRDKSLPVKVGLMSDRTCTVDKLTSYLEQKNITVVAAKHDEPSPDTKVEHGPFAGAAFFVDMAIVSAARSAFIAMSRSSSDLMRELIVFDQIMERWEARLDNSQDRVTQCTLPYISDPDAKKKGEVADA